MYPSFQRVLKKCRFFAYTFIPVYTELFVVDEMEPVASGTEGKACDTLIIKQYWLFLILSTGFQ